jgi:hypothetical protein
MPFHEGMTPQILIIFITTAAQEQDNHSKSKRPKINYGLQSLVTDLDQILRPRPSYKGEEGRPRRRAISDLA